jgi:Protein of unknown function (DUF664)
MPGSARPVTDEFDGLLTFLEQQRLGLRATLHGLTDEQASTTPTASTLCLAGLLKHAAHTERGWMVVVAAQRPLPEPEPGYDEQFRLAPGETVADVVEFYAKVAAETEAIAAELGLEHPVPVPEAPWYPDDLEFWSVRWVLLHLIEETARHGGHADIIRESIDGSTFYELIDATEAAV